MKSYTLAKVAAAAVVGLSATACAAVPPSTPQVAVPPIAQVSITNVQGSVSYRERIMLLPGSTMHVSVQDVSRADARAETIADVNYTLQGSGPPYGYSIRVFNDRIDPQHTYAVRAEIRNPRGEVIFTTDTRHEVLTRGNSNTADIVLVRVGQGS